MTGVVNGPSWSFVLLNSQGAKCTITWNTDYFKIFGSELLGTLHVVIPIKQFDIMLILCLSPFPVTYNCGVLWLILTVMFHT